MKASFFRWFAVKWSGKDLRTLQIEFIFWHFMTRSNVKAYCKVVLS